MYCISVIVLRFDITKVVCITFVRQPSYARYNRMKIYFRVIVAHAIIEKTFFILCIDDKL